MKSRRILTVAILVICGVAVCGTFALFQRCDNQAPSDVVHDATVYAYTLTAPQSVTITRFFTSPLSQERESTSYTLQNAENTWKVVTVPDLRLMQNAVQQITETFASLAIMRTLTEQEYQNIVSTGFITENNAAASVTVNDFDGTTATILFLRALPDTSGWYARVTYNDVASAVIVPIDTYALCGFSAEALQNPPRFRFPPQNAGFTAVVNNKTTLDVPETATLIERLSDLSYARVVAVAVTEIAKTVTLVPPPSSTAGAVTVTKHLPLIDRETGEPYDIYTVSGDPNVYRILPLYSPL